MLFGAILTVWMPERRPLGIFQAGVECVAMLEIARRLWRGSPVRGSRLLVPLAGVLALGAVQLAAWLTTYRPATRESLIDWGAAATLVFLAAQLFGDLKARHRFLRALFYFAFAVSVLALAQFRSSHGSVLWLFPTGYSELVMGPFVSQNLYSAFIELLLPIGLFQAVSGRRPWMYGAMCGIMLASVVAGASRAGLAITASEVAAVLVAAQWRGLASARRGLFPMGAIAAAGAVLVAFAGGTSVWQRLRDGDPYAGRREMLRSSIDMVRERPWIGFGLGTWSIHYPRFAYYDDGTVTGHAHNDWAEWAAEGGLPLLALMVSLAALTIPSAWRSVWGVGVAALWVHCLLDSPLQNPVVAGWFFLIAGMLTARGRRATPPGL
jgi:O-antigen ligase